MSETSPSPALNVLASPAIGSGTTDLVVPCGRPRPSRREPPPVPGRLPLAVTLSGGGFRATLAGLGTLRFLADAGLLGDVRWVSSVSGGSVANGVLAVSMPDLRSGEFTREAFDAAVVRPFVDQISAQSLKGRLLRNAWKLVGSRTRTELLAEEFDELFLHDLLLEDLDPDVRFIINAADTSTGVRFGFERDVLGDYVVGQIPTAGTRLRLSTAVAASAAVPGPFPPLTPKGLPQFPCQQGRTIRLVDGGAYDNMGLEPVDDLRDAFLLAVNAGGVFVTGRYGRVPVARDLELANSLLYRQSTALRRRHMVERFRAYEDVEEVSTGRTREAPQDWARHGILFGLTSTFEAADERLTGWRAVNPDEPDVDRLARVATSFDQFDRDLCRDLIHAGWWLTGACLTAYHPHLLAHRDRPPAWSVPW